MAAITLPRLTITNHAWMRIGQMGLSREDVLAVVIHPETDYPTDRGRRIAQAGEVAVCYQPDARVIVTVLPRTAEVYLRPEKRRHRWRHEPEQVIAALLTVGSEPETAAAALTYFGVDATALMLDAGRWLLHIAAMDQLVDTATGRRWQVPSQLYLEEPFELDGETYRYIPSWTSVEHGDVDALVASMRIVLETEKAGATRAA